MLNDIRRKRWRDFCFLELLVLHFSDSTFFISSIVLSCIYFGVSNGRIEEYLRCPYLHSWIIRSLSRCSTPVKFLAWSENIFLRLNIPGPKRRFFVGNLAETFGVGTNTPLQLKKWTEEYGPIYGFYQGSRPVLVVSDSDMAQEILIKQFNNFYGRKEFAIQPHPESGDRVNMFTARGAKWKRLRVIANPTFTSAKIKQTVPTVRECISEMLGIIEQKRKEDRGFDVSSVYQAFTLDVIARVAFAYEGAVQANADGGFMQLVKAVSTEPPSKLTYIAMVFPSIRRLLFHVLSFYSAVKGSPMTDLRERIKQIPVRTDFIQLLLDAEADEKDVSPDTKNGFSNFLDVKKKLTIGEIASQSFLFLFAGFETTSMTLSFIAYLLATNQEVQQRLAEEIDQYVSSDEDITYEKVNKIQYLEAVIQETLRLYPIAVGAVNRRCMESCTVNGHFIPKDMELVIDVLSLHYNESIWGPDAKEFNPERFMSQPLPHPFAYLPFGGGPRICIGMRFAMVEMKMALCYMLKRYTIVECVETEKPVQVSSKANITLFPKNGVFVNFKERK